MIRLKPLEFNEGGFAHTPVGLLFRVQLSGELWVAEMQNLSTTIKSPHDHEDAARSWCQLKYEEIIAECFY